MKKKSIYIFIFIIVFVLSAILEMKILGSRPERLLKVKWTSEAGTIIKDLTYGEKEENTYDLYVPADLHGNRSKKLILYIHGGSFNSGAKEDGETWCKYYTAQGFITASVNYTLQNHGEEASLLLMNKEIEEAVAAIKRETDARGCAVDEMAVCGVSAGGTLAMNFAYTGQTAIPVEFVFQLSAPTYFIPSEWGLLMKVDHLKNEEEFIRMMTGKELSLEEAEAEIDQISPARNVTENSVPTLIGYGMKDHAVPLTQKYYLIDALRQKEVPYTYIEFPHSNHGMYSDPEQLLAFIRESIAYADRYFSE